MPLLVDDFVENPEYDRENGGKSTLYDYMGNKWVILVTHKSFLHPVFATELNALFLSYPEIEKRGVKLMAIATDTKESLEILKKDSVILFGGEPLEFQFDVVADATGRFSKELGLLRSEADELKGMQLKRRASEFLTPSILIVDKYRRVRWRASYPENVGRNFQELIRCLDAALLVAEHEVECRSNWAKGEDVFVKSGVTPKQAAAMFSRGIIMVKPWLRLTPMPTERDVAFRKQAEERERKAIQDADKLSRETEGGA